MTSPAAPATAPAKKTGHQKDVLQKRRRWLLVGGPLLFLVAAVAFYLMTGRYVSTDDAYVAAARTDISSNISGRVTEVDVHDNQPVHKGDVLFKLDTQDLTLAVQNAEAHLADIKLKVSALKATYLQRQADVTAAKSALAYAQSELARQKKLTKEGIASQAHLDAAQNAVAQAEQKLAAAKQHQANTVAALGGNPDIAVDAHPAVMQAADALEQAKLDLSYAVIHAPADGIVTRVELLQVGTYIKAATPVFALVSDKNIWIEANFKETDLTYMHAGQAATVTFDAYPDAAFHGTVVSVSPGTGASFSVLPPENATGNWVKVVQRLPVRIDLSTTGPHVALEAGLSASVSVDTHHSRSKALKGSLEAFAHAFGG